MTRTTDQTTDPDTAQAGVFTPACFFAHLKESQMKGNTTRPAGVYTGLFL